MKRKKLLIIPARMGSKRIKRKNIKIFNGKPMISYSLSAATNCNIFDEIHISTESQEMLDLISALGFKPKFIRPMNLSKDETPLIEVVKYVVNKYESLGSYYDDIGLLLPCSPLIDFNDLNRAFNIYIDNGCQLPILSVTEFDTPISRALKKIGDIYKPLNIEAMKKRTQDLECHYHDTGNFAIFPRKFIDLEQDVRLKIGFLGYVLAKEKAIDIDTESDWKIADMLYKMNNLD